MATVKAYMNFCQKTHTVTVNQREDGDFDVHIESDCEFVNDYAGLLKKITMDDLTDNRTSAITDPEKLKYIMGPCLAPNAVFNAGWLEAGMFAKSLARKVKQNVISFEDLDSEL
ncbi:MAG: hypothetical protein WC067_00545 [Candidatus Methanomethylophilaceae archaeon]